MPTTEEFRARARAWLVANARPAGQAGPADAEGATVPLEEARRFQRALWEAGLAGITWPADCGGQGLGPAEQAAFNEEAAAFDLPTGPFLIGLGMPGNTLVVLGTQAQRKRYLPPMLSGQEIWCQLFSEPSAGSDVASLRTTATRTETGWVLNGQKVWTSGAQISDFGAIIARTDPTVPKHKGITMFIVDMRAPGVSVRPLRVATGDAPFNEVFFDNVEVPADAVIGEVGKGWDAAIVMLRFERIVLGAGGRARSNPLGFESLLAAARSRGLEADPAARRLLAQVHARQAGLLAYGRLLQEEAAAGTQVGARGSVAKLASAVFGLWASDAALEIFGEDAALGQAGTEPLVTAMILAPGVATAGGSNEIQRNIVAERVLGLAKDPGVDRDTPFNQLRLSS